MWWAGAVDLTPDELAELRALTTSVEVSAAVGTRARIVLWQAEGRRKTDIAALAGVSRPTVDLWLARYAAEGTGGLLNHKVCPATTLVASQRQDRIHGPGLTLTLREAGGWGV
jgi:hypothetical protein